ncbi:MAG: hypothetical protein A3K03_05945 [Bdellovibrionales bacterium RIFOXYD1_FULL_44_7]|nr:MAG: hypothetical protein A3K03_05945 [Bdellovibrionales bacterium RIFOXYD1_FULL_44_7]
MMKRVAVYLSVLAVVIVSVALANDWPSSPELCIKDIMKKGTIGDKDNVIAMCVDPVGRVYSWSKKNRAEKDAYMNCLDQVANIIEEEDEE